MLEGLDQLAQFIPNSPIAVINILGWIFFFGISNITLAFSFESTSKRNLLKWGFLINGIFCVITSILFILGLGAIMFVWIVVLTIIWYTYPMLTVLFRKGELKLR